MSPDFLTPIGPSQFDAILGPRTGPDSAAAVGPDQLAVLQGSAVFASAAYNVLLIDPATFDPTSKVLVPGLPDSGIDLSAPSPGAGISDGLVDLARLDRATDNAR